MLKLVGVRGLALICCLAPLIGRAAPVLTEDFELGLELKPVGAWDRIITGPASVTLATTSVAAHRGKLGLKLVDGDGASGAGTQGGLQLQATVTSGDFYVRSWVRLAASNGLGDFFFTYLQSPGPLLTVNAGLQFPGPQLHIQSGGVSFFDDKTGAAFPLNEWVLVEVGLTGLGTSTGAERLWWNGSLVFQRSGLAWSSTRLEQVAIGQSWADDRRFIGELHFDDVRFDTQAPASALALSAAAPATSCTALTLSLSSSAGGMPVGPYAILADVTGDVFSDDHCLVPTASLTIPAGAPSVTGSVRPGAVVRARHPDFLEASLAVPVLPDSSVGVPLRPSEVGCGCSQAPSILWAGAALTRGAWRRRRTKKVGITRR